MSHFETCCLAWLSSFALQITEGTIGMIGVPGTGFGAALRKMRLTNPIQHAILVRYPQTDRRTGEHLMPPLTPADEDHPTRELRTGQVVLHQVNCEPGALFVALERGVTKYTDPWRGQYFYAPGEEVRLRKHGC